MRLPSIIVLLLLVVIVSWPVSGAAQQQGAGSLTSSLSSGAEREDKGKGGEVAGPSAAYEQAMARGVRALNNNEFAGALAAFGEAKAAGPGKPEPLYYLGVTLDKLNRPKEAVAPLRQAIAMDPRVPRIHFALGVVLFGLEQYSQALPEFVTVEQAEPAYEPSIWMRAMAFYYQGLIYHKLGTFTRSAPLFLKAIHLLPGVGRTAHYYAGIGFFRQGLLDEAQEQFEDTIKDNPEESEIAKSARSEERRVGKECRL